MNRHENTMGCERCLDGAAYVLGALGEDELRSFREHLDECAICRDEVAQLQPSADSLAIGVAQEIAPESLRARISTTVHAEAGLPGAGDSQSAEAELPGAGDSRSAGAELPGASGHGVDRRTGENSIQARSRWRSRLVPALVAAAALGVGVLIGALAIDTGSAVRQTQTQVVKAAVEEPGHHATAELRQVGSHLELLVVGLPAPTKGRIYEVWLVPRGAQTPQPTDALFSVTDRGEGSVGVPGDARDIGKVLVTDEPLGGSPKPTRNPVIVAST